MSIYKDLQENFSELKEKADKEKNHYLFTDDGIFLTRDRRSDARYPYVRDGRVLWAHANGKIHLSESDFFLIPETNEGETSFLSFYLGIRKGDSFVPVSLFDFDHNVFEPMTQRATFFSYHSATYILKTEGILYFVTLTLDEKKNLLLYGKALNTADEEKEVYSSFYFNPRLRHSNYSSVETKWFKKSFFEDECFTFDTTEDLSRDEHLYHRYYLKRNAPSADIRLNTTSRLIYCDSKTGNKDSSPCLLRGKFSEEKNVTCFSDTAIAGDFLRRKLKPKESLEFSYQLTDQKDFLSLENIRSYFESLPTQDKTFDIFEFRGNQKTDAEKFTDFSKRLVKQVDYCAGTKNSTLRRLGFRDIFQALEAAVLFKPERVREKILGCLDYVSVSGRCPRQFAWSISSFVKIDAREFIDQGLWVIDCIYQYLAYTGDYSILDETRRYIEIREDASACFSERKDSVLSHRKQRRDYLIGNIDPETSCLKMLYGDWNDAIDGLGKGEEKNEFGNGVSVRATFQLYSALGKFMEILEKADPKDKDWIDKSLRAKKVIEQGLLKHAFVRKGNEAKIIHGWGNHQSFYVGSFDDIDHKSRDTLTSNSFYVLSGFYKDHREYTDAVLYAYKKLEGKYGYKTFDPFFDKDAYKVGRIVNLPKGTAENAATYIHASVFALDSLFLLNRPKEAFNEIFRLVPINHEFISTTPFVRPNSYVFNPEIGCDGESRNDWFTGSSSTLLKSLVRNAFGFDPSLDGIRLHPASYFPFEQASRKLCFRGKKIRILYKHQEGRRTIQFDNRHLMLNDEEKGLRKDTAFIPFSDLKEENTILIG